MDLKGKTVVVTGVSKGIGKALCLRLLEKGSNVYGLGRTNNDIVDDGYQFLSCDVQNYEVVRDCIAEVNNKGNNIDVLVNNAGLGFFSNFEDTTLEDWDLLMRTNVNGVFYCCKEVIPIMKAQQSGHIINISSIAGLTGIPTAGPYCATKHAVRGISHTLYKELRKDNIRVSCIYPGSVNTNFFDNIDEVNPNETMMSPFDIANSIINVLEMPDNVLTVDVELRPMNAKYS